MQQKKEKFYYNVAKHSFDDILLNIYLQWNKDMYQNNGITQRIMAKLLGCSATKVNRYINNSDIKSIPQETGKNLRYSPLDTRKVISVLSPPHSIKKKIQCFYNFKGGTGKTSVAFQASSHLALLGYKILVVDADPQAHLSTALGFSEEAEQGATLYDVLVGGLDVREAILPIYEGFDCIVSNLSLTRIELPLTQMPRREHRVIKTFEPLKQEYDFIIFDTNPTISHLNRNIIVASDRINIVCETQPFSVNGLGILMTDLGNFFLEMGSTTPEIYIIPNKYEGKMSTAQETMGLLYQKYGEYIVRDFALRKSEDINVSAKISLPLAFFCKTNSNALSDIIELLNHIIDNSKSSDSLFEGET